MTITGAGRSADAPTSRYSQAPRSSAAEGKDMSKRPSAVSVVMTCYAGDQDTAAAQAASRTQPGARRIKPRDREGVERLR